MGHHRGHFSFKYECEICGAKFVKNHNLNSHLEGHDSIYYRCLICAGKKKSEETTFKAIDNDSGIADMKLCMRSHFRRCHLDGSTVWNNCKKYVEIITEKDLTIAERERMQFIRSMREEKLNKDRKTGKNTGI